MGSLNMPDGKWDSAELKSTSLYEGGFNPSIVMISEDHQDITQFAEYLDQTTASGIRPKFTSINAQEIAKKVRKYLGMSSRTSITKDDPRMDSKLWAEAIKHVLLEFKKEISVAPPPESDKPEEITGARSKDMMRYIPPIENADVSQETPSTAGLDKRSRKKGKSKSKVNVKKSKSGAGKKGKKKQEDTGTDTEMDTENETTDAEKKGRGKNRKNKNKKGEAPTTTENDETTDAETGTEPETSKKIKKGGKKNKGKETTEDDTGIDTGGEDGETKGKKLKGKKSKSKSKDKLKGKKSKSKKLIRTASLPLDGKKRGSTTRHTLLRKRGQPKMPLMTVSDDSPKDGPQLYVFLQGFYNPDILDALNDVGVKLDGILLLTRNKVDKRNFSVIDIEENFPDTFRPQNILPDYLKKILEKYDKVKPEKKDQVSKFWIDLAKKLNEAPPDSFIHDVALLNCEMPPIPVNLTTEEIGIHSVALLEEVAKRIYEMNLFKSWHQTYTSNTKIDKIEILREMETPNKIYEELINKVPAECVTLPVIMESLLAQVVYNVDEAEAAERQRKSLQKHPTNPRENSGEDENNEDVEIREILKPKSKSQKWSSSRSKEDNEKKLSKKMAESRKSSKKSKDMTKTMKVDEAEEETEEEEADQQQQQDMIYGYPNYYNNNNYNNEYNFNQEEDEEMTAEDNNNNLGPFLSVDGRVSRIMSRPGKYYPYLSSEIQRQKSLNLCDPPKKLLVPSFKGPLYIKSHDYASIRTCHLEENFAAAVASDQVSGDFSHMRGFLWDTVPDFNKGLYMKLHGNLTHFMHFLPPDSLDFKDMFFILHLLLAVGVEIQLQKDARDIMAKEIEEHCSVQDAVCCDRVAGKFRSLLEIHETPRIIDGTNLDLSHNYLALGAEFDKATKFLLTPGSKDKFNVILNSTETEDQKNKQSLKVGAKPSCSKRNLKGVQSKALGASDKESPRKSKGVEDELMYLLKPTEEQDSTDTGRGGGKVAGLSDNQGQEEEASTVEKIHGAAVATGNIILQSAEIVAGSGDNNNPVKPASQNGSTMKFPSTPPNTANPTDPLPPDRVDSAYRLYFGKGQSQGQGSNRGDMKETCGDEGTAPTDLSILQALIDCPALLAISESGALDLSKWVQTHLLCTGLTRAAGEGMLIGNLKDWNYAEELVPVQMIQSLSDAANSYLCMERVYCPFYDTILFIFNNPTPYSLHAEASFITQLKTVPGLQHFLEYTINDEEVKDFVMDVEKQKGPMETVSVETLMRLIPQDQWLLIPSIKFRLQKLEKESRLLFNMADEETEEEEEEEDGQQSGRSTGKSKSGLTLKKGKRTRKRNRIDLGDGEGRPDSDDEDEQGKKVKIASDSENEVGGKKNKKKKKGKGSKSPKVKKSKSTTDTETETDTDRKKRKKGKGKKGISSESQVDTSASENDGKKLKGKKSKSKSKSKDKLKAKKSKSKSKSKGKKGKKGKSDDETTEDEKRGRKPGEKIPDEIETPLPILTPTDGSTTELHRSSKSKFKDAQESESDHDRLYKNKVDKTFNVYDLGKRIYVLTSDDFHLFPLDGTVISYNVSTIEPAFRMMQLKVSKNGHETIFYPYYIPELAMSARGGAANLQQESFVLCPCFHTVLANGTVVAFQDRRAGEDLQNFKLVDPPEKSRSRPGSTTFSFDQIRFLDQNYESLLNSQMWARRMDEMGGEDALTMADKEGPPPGPGQGQSDLGQQGQNQNQDQAQNKETEKPEEDQNQKPEEKLEEKPSKTKKVKKSKSKSKSKSKDKLSKGSKGKDKKKGESDKAEDEGNKKKGKKGKKGKTPRPEKEKELEKNPNPKDGDEQEKLDQDKEEEEEEIDEDREAALEKEMMDKEKQQGPPVGEWKYPSSDETDIEDFNKRAVPSRTFISFGWADAEPLLVPLAHFFKITLPSGLYIQVQDVQGPPLQREVKQTYMSKGSAFSYVESCRYYTMNGSVIRFLTDGTIQILNARGVTTNIREISAHVENVDFGEDEDPRNKFEGAFLTKVWKGDVILADGEFWHISYGKRVRHAPLFLFTSGTLPNGEIFRRRQDGTIYIHRNDGCCIIHYPDGTRFTTRMVIQRDPDPDFPDWEFIGLKYMIEHPNYCPVIFNTLSGNIHIRVPQGEWARIFADGSIRFGLSDEYKLDVNHYTATLSCPPIFTHSPGTNEPSDIPNCTVVKLFHSFDHLQSQNSGSDDGINQPNAFTYTDTEGQGQGQEGQSNDPENDINLSQSGPFNVTGDLPDYSSTGQRGSQSHSEGQNQGQGQVPFGQMDKNLRPVPNLAQQTQYNQLSHGGGSRKSIKTIILNDPMGKNGDMTFNGDELHSQTQSQSHFPPPRQHQSTHSVGDLNQSDRRSTLGQGSKSITIIDEKSTMGEKKSKKKFEIAQFFIFTDLWTLVKSIDSYDNRFAMDIFGSIAVDKSCDARNEKAQSQCQSQPPPMEEVFDTLACNFSLPKKILSGLLQSTSSEEMNSHTKRLNLLRKAQSVCCHRKPKTRIFIVKRDLSGYEFLREASVDRIIRRGKANPESMVLVDPLPSKKPRKFLTIMEPIHECENPHGVWKNLYREPVFRPTYLCNKNLKLSRPEDLRWFAHILSRAHGKRGKFFLSPKEQFLVQKEKAEQREREAKLAEERQKELEAEMAAQKAKEEAEAEEELRKKREAEEGDNEEESEDQGKKAKGKKSKKKLDKSKSKSKDKGKKEGKGKDKDGEDDEKSKNKSKKKSEMKVGKKNKGKEAESEAEGKKKAKKKKSKKTVPNTTPVEPKLEIEEDEEDQEETEEAEQQEEEEIVILDAQNDEPSSSSSYIPTKPKQIGKEYPGDYPQNLGDVKGLYGPEPTDTVQISPYHHTDIIPTRKAIVVKTIVEIPRLDENLQNLLLLASASYAKNVAEEKKVLNSYSQVEDPRTEEEKEEEKRVRRELVEENIQSMKMLQQSAGKILDLII